MDQQQIVLKSSLAGSDELRRRTIAIPSSGLTLDELESTVSSIHRLNQPFKLSWRDDDNDDIFIAADADVNEAIQCCVSQPKHVLRLTVRVIQDRPRSGRCGGFNRGTCNPNQRMKQSLANLTGIPVEQASQLIDRTLSGDDTARTSLAEALQGVVLDRERGQLGWPKSRQALERLQALANGQPPSQREAAPATARAETAADLATTEFEPQVQALVQMGFSAAVALAKIEAANGNIDAALEAALADAPHEEIAPFEHAAELARLAAAEEAKAEATRVAVERVAAQIAEEEAELACVAAKEAVEWLPEWDLLLGELAEMGFEDPQANKRAIAAHNGDLKSTVSQLVAQERASQA